LHRNPVTGEPNPINLGWLDDSMTLNGPTEEDSHYIADTGASPQSMIDQVAAVAILQGWLDQRRNAAMTRRE
jgi:hypothetical protein